MGQCLCRKNPQYFPAVWAFGNILYRQLFFTTSAVSQRRHLSILIRLLERHTTVQNEARWTQSKVGLHLSRAAFYAAIFLTAIGALRLWQLLTMGRKRWNAWIPHQLAVYPRLGLLWALIFIPIFAMSSSGIFSSSYCLVALFQICQSWTCKNDDVVSIKLKLTNFSFLFCHYRHPKAVSGGSVTYC